MQSVLAWVRMWGGSVEASYAIHTAVALSAAVATMWLWRGPARYPLKAAGLATAAIIAALHSHDYDLMVLAPAIAFCAADGLSHGFRPYEKSLLAMIWLMPLLTRTIAQATLLPLGTLATLVLFALVLRRAGWPAIAPLQAQPRSAERSSSH